MAFAADVNASLPMSAAGTDWPAVTTAPSSASVPAAGSVTTVTLASASPTSGSEKLKSDAAKVYAVSSLVITDELDAVGALGSDAAGAALGSNAVSVAVSFGGA